MKRLKYFALAALVAFAACDEGDEVVVPEPVTGSITGTVTVDGSGLAGVTVTLSSGATATTAANGSFTFSGVEAGAYTVSISGTPSDAAFPTTSQAAVIASAGQVVNLSFSGSFITTSAISASVSAPGIGALVGATVSISGQSSASQTTGTSGTVTFSGLRAGSYTVAVALSAADAALYDLASSSQAVTLAVDELQAVAFTATPKTISTISGTLFIDELPKNNTFESTAEEAVAAANIQLIIEGVSVGVFDTVQTAADGTFELNNLPAANYRIILNTSDSDIPGALAFGGTDNEPVITLGVADSEVVNFPFDIIEQKVTVGSFLGIDGTSSARTNPLSGSPIRIYPTEALASAMGGGFIGSGTTSAGGEVTIAFDRDDDFQPGSSASDNIVFAWVSTPLAGLTQNGEMIIEIPFAAQDSIVTAGDEFDYTSNSSVVKVNVQELDGDTYAQLATQFLAPDSLAPASGASFTNADGEAIFNLTTDGNDYFFRLSPSQVGLPTAELQAFPFTSQATADRGDLDGSFLVFENVGLVAPTDTVNLGTIDIIWSQAEVNARMHTETNDVQNWQSGSETVFAPLGVAEVQVQRDNAGTWVDVGAAVTVSNVDGDVPLPNQSTGETYRLVGTSTSTNSAVLNDTIVVVGAVDGSDQVIDVCPLRDSGSTFATCSTFAFKRQTGRINGRIRFRDGTNAPAGTQVIVSSADSTIQGRVVGNQTADTVAVNASGLFTTTQTVREGYYNVTPVSDAPTIVFYQNVNGGTKVVEIEGPGVTVAPAPGTPAVSGAAGAPAATSAQFHGYSEETSVSGVVVNDRDADGNTIDTDEALIGASVTLYRDDFGSFATSPDSIVGTAVTGADGSYTFPDLREGAYRVVAVAPGAEDVVPANLTMVTQATNDPDIGSVSPSPLPRWDYSANAIAAGTEGISTGAPAGSQFTFLFNDGRVTGTVTDGGTPVASITVTLARCGAGAPANTLPTVGDCAEIPSTFQNFVTQADGVYTFSGLREGIYEVTVIPGSAGYTAPAPPNDKFLVFVDGRGDIEVVDYAVS